MGAEKRVQKEEENMNYMTEYMWDNLAKRKERDTDTDGSTYTYFR